MKPTGGRVGAGVGGETLMSSGKIQTTYCLFVYILFIIYIPTHFPSHIILMELFHL